MRTKKVSREELGKLLNLSLNTIIKMTEEEIKQILEESGYKYYGVLIKNKKILYKITLVNKKQKEVYDMCKKEFKTTQANEFCTYFIKRTENEEILSKKDISELSETTLYNIQKWDKIMLEKDIISENEIKYFRIKNNIKCEMSRQDYLNSILDEEILKIEKKYINNKINLKEYTEQIKKYINNKIKQENTIYYKTDKYTTNKDNDIYKKIVKLIRG